MPDAETTQNIKNQIAAAEAALKVARDEHQKLTMIGAKAEADVLMRDIVAQEAQVQKFKQAFP